MPWRNARSRSAPVSGFIDIDGEDPEGFVGDALDWLEALASACRKAESDDQQCWDDATMGDHGQPPVATLPDGWKPADVHAIPAQHSNNLLLLNPPPPDTRIGNQAS